MKMIYKIVLFLIITLSAFIFYSCAASLGSGGLKGDSSVTQLDYNVFRVTLRGNAYTSMERESDIILLRSAELTHNNGYKYFTMMDEEKYKNESNNIPAYDSETRNVKKSQITNTIITCFKEKPKEFSYNAKFIIDSLKKKYDINDY